MTPAQLQQVAAVLAQSSCVPAPSEKGLLAVMVGAARDGRHVLLRTHFGADPVKGLGLLAGASN